MTELEVSFITCFV